MTIVGGEAWVTRVDGGAPRTTGPAAVEGDRATAHAIGPVAVVDGRDAVAAATAIASADLVATSVGLNVLPRLGGVFASALTQRTGPLDVILAENGMQVREVLRTAVAAAGGDVTRLGLIRASIGRMIPPPAPGAPVSAPSRSADRDTLRRSS